MHRIERITRRLLQVKTEDHAGHVGLWLICYNPEQEEDIVCATRNCGIKYDVGSSHPGAGEGPKGLAVRQLKRYASWVQNVVRQFGLLSVVGVEHCENSSLVREDRDGRTSGVPAVPAKGNAG